MKKRAAVMIGAMVAGPIASSVEAKKGFVVHPTQVGDETAWYGPGRTIVSLEKPGGTIQVIPLLRDHGSVAFSVAVLNTGDAPANISLDDIRATVGKETLVPFTGEQLASKAASRAMWTQIGLAMAGAASAAVLASQRDHYRSTLRTPRGTYRYTYSAPSTAGQVGAAAAVGGAAYGIARVQDQLERTRVAIGESTMTTATIDPGESFAGRVVFTKIKDKRLPGRLDMTIRWAGSVYPFSFVYGDPTIPLPTMRLTPTPPPPPVPIPEQVATAPVEGPPAQSVASELSRLADLRRQGVLTESEFVAAKAKLLQ